MKDEQVLAADRVVAHSENRFKLLAVDDEPANLMLLREVLQNDYKMIFAKNGADAIKRVGQKPDLIILDVMMPEMDGFEVCKQLKADSETQHIPIIFLTARIEAEDEVRGFELGAADYITKPINPVLVRKRVETQLALHNQRRLLENEVLERTAELLSTRLEVVQRLGKAAEFKDNETGKHVIRISHCSRLIAEAAGWSTLQAELIENAAPMHDIGKIGIPDSVLLKPGKLTPEEWSIMQSHCEVGAEIIGDNHSKLMKMAKVIALHHHEKWDGSGYPHGLSGSNIPIAARIVAIADVFDALVSERPYKKAWSVEQAVDFITGQAGNHFDPALVPLFVKKLPKIIEMNNEYPD